MESLSKPEKSPGAKSTPGERQSRDRAQFRPTAEQKALLVRAATLSGQTLSAFMSTAIEEKAQRVIADHERIVLGERAREAFFSALAHPPAPNDRLTALAERYAREVKSRP
jgi:uncharacterized protein (DUF1778 family)